jgi:hypothetical protein
MFAQMGPIALRMLGTAFDPEADVRRDRTKWSSRTPHIYNGMDIHTSTLGWSSSGAQMPIGTETLREIRTLVRGGFNRRDEIVAIFCEEMYAPGELDQQEIEASVDSEFAALEKEKERWPAVTDCDKLDAVFRALNERGLIALQNAGYTQSDGYDDMRAAYQSHPDKRQITGYCFYHGQDLARAIDGGGLYLAFGPIDSRKEETEGPAVGSLIVEELKRAGLEVDWNGSFEQRIRIRNIDWKRR